MENLEVKFYNINYVRRKNMLNKNNGKEYFEEEFYNEIFEEEK